MREQVFPMLGAQIHISSEALFQEIGGEGVILDLASSTYFGLDEVGVRTWQLLQDNPNLQNALEALLEEYEVSADQLEQDIDKLVRQLIDAGLASIE
jgi:hypothetical protein